MLERRDAVRFSGVSSGSFIVHGVVCAILLVLISSDLCTCTLNTRCPGNQQYWGFSLIAAESSCKHYVMCFMGQLSTELPCPPRSAFDSQLKTCTYVAFDACEARESLPQVENQVSCSLGKGVEAFFPDYRRGCPDSRYFRCGKDGVLSAMTCPDSLVFDEGTDSCVSRDKVKCAAKGGPVCTRPEGVYANYSSGCPAKEFFICTGEGTSIGLSCPDGLYYSGPLKNCDYSSNIVCGVNVPP